MFLSVSDLTVHLHQDGPPGAPALLLLHSLGTSGAIWETTAEALKSGFRIIRPDLRGHGLTSVTPGPYEIDGLARDALALLDALGVGTAHVAGISVGGLIAQSLALQAPDRVLSLMLLDTALALPRAADWQARAASVRAEGIGPMVEAIVGRWVTPGFSGNANAHGLRTILSRTPPEGYAATAEAIAAADFTQTSRAIRVRTLVLVGDQDAATPLASAKTLHDAIPGSKLVVIPDTAHIPMVERPQNVISTMRSFLASGTASSNAYETGLTVRRQVLGEAHVARASAAVTDLDRDFQHFITCTAWDGVWNRPHFDRRTRSIITLALLAALGHHEEFALHVRASRRTGASEADIAELLIQVSVYAGIPAANSAVRIAKEILAEDQKHGHC